MATAKDFIDEWTKSTESSKVPKFPLSCRIPVTLNEQLEALAQDFGIGKTDAVISCLKVGMTSFLKEKQIRKYIGLKTFEEFCDSPDMEVSGNIQDAYEAYVALAEEKREELLENAEDELGFRSDW